MFKIEEIVYRDRWVRVSGWSPLKRCYWNGVLLMR